MDHSGNDVRIDKWLWAARFFKTRALAIEAIKQGRVQCNKSRPKPSRNVRVGDLLIVEKADMQFEIEVLVLSDKRGAAPIAQTLYAESETSRKVREDGAALRKAQRLSSPTPPPHKPGKHQRQQIRQFLGK